MKAETRSLLLHKNQPLLVPLLLQPSSLTTLHSHWGRNNLLVWIKALPVTGLLYKRDVDTCTKLWVVILHCRGEPSPF